MRPNLQNQPKVSKFQIRSMYEAEPGKIFIIADYSQLELRILAHLANCKSMIMQLNTGGDFHSQTALGMSKKIQDDIESGKVQEKDIGKVFKKERNAAKTINFGIAYGMGAMTLKERLDIELNEARDYVDKWYMSRPEVEDWQFRTIARMIRTGRTYTLQGRSRVLFDPEEFFGKQWEKFITDVVLELEASDPKNMQERRAEQLQMKWREMRADAGKLWGNEGVPHELARYIRQAINTPVQGGAADVVMMAMLNIHRSIELHDLGFKLCLQIHDELILEGPEGNAEQAKDIVQKLMEKPFDHPLTVNLDVDISVRKCWQE